MGYYTYELSSTSTGSALGKLLDRLINDKYYITKANDKVAFHDKGSNSLFGLLIFSIQYLLNHFVSPVSS